MLTVEYGERKFDRLAWDAIDRGEPLDVVVRGWRVWILRRSMPLCAAFFGRERRSGPHTPRREAARGAVWLVQPMAARDLQSRDHRWDDSRVARKGGSDPGVVQAAPTLTSAYTLMAPRSSASRSIAPAGCTRRRSTVGAGRALLARAQVMEAGYEGYMAKDESSGYVGGPMRR